MTKERDRENGRRMGGAKGGMGKESRKKGICGKVGGDGRGMREVKNCIVRREPQIRP
jgi:hypothetical protein